MIMSYIANLVFVQEMLEVNTLYIYIFFYHRYYSHRYKKDYIHYLEYTSIIDIL